MTLRLAKENRVAEFLASDGYISKFEKDIVLNQGAL